MILPERCVYCKIVETYDAAKECFNSISENDDIVCPYEDDKTKAIEVAEKIIREVL